MNAIRTLALIVALALLAHSVMAQNKLGRIITAVWTDAITFCKRQPQACSETRELTAEWQSKILPATSDQPSIATHGSAPLPTP
ncbi:MAG: hypothetical protein AAF580_03655 [Pseudomonadota bacterium]